MALFVSGRERPCVGMAKKGEDRGRCRGGTCERIQRQAVADALNADARLDVEARALKPVSIGILGCGAWGPNHIRVFDSIEGSTVRVAVDPDPNRLARVRRLNRSIEVAEDAEAALADPDVSAVVVATPTSTHYELVRRALEAGKHVLAEKPLAQTSTEAQTLVELAHNRNLALMVGHVFLYNAGIVKLHEALEAGEVGRPLFLQAVRTNLGPIRGDVNAAYDLATHDISIFNWLLGAEPALVSASGAAFLQPDVEDVVSISLKYSEGVFATIQASWLNPKKVRQITIVGSKGMMTWDDLELSNPVAVFDKRAEATEAVSDYGEFLRISMSDGDVRLPKIALEEPLRAQAQAFLEAIRGGQDGRAGGTEAVKVVRTLEAVQRSLSLKGAPVPIGEADA
jgi:predicted dehydrogenase